MLYKYSKSFFLFLNCFVFVWYFQKIKWSRKGVNAVKNDAVSGIWNLLSNKKYVSVHKRLKITALTEVLKIPILYLLKTLVNTLIPK